MPPTLKSREEEERENDENRRVVTCRRRNRNGRVMRHRERERRRKKRSGCFAKQGVEVGCGIELASCSNLATSEDKPQMIADIYDGKLHRVPTIHSKVAEWQCDPELGHRFNISQLIIRDKSLLAVPPPPLFPSGHHRATKISHSNQSRTDGRRRTSEGFSSLFFSISRGESAHQARLSHSLLRAADPKNAMDLSGAKSGSAEGTTITTAKRVAYRSAISNLSLLAENTLSYYTKTEMYAKQQKDACSHNKTATLN